MHRHAPLPTTHHLPPPPLTSHHQHSPICTHPPPTLSTHHHHHYHQHHPPIHPTIHPSPPQHAYAFLSCAADQPASPVLFSGLTTPRASTELRRCTTIARGPGRGPTSGISITRAVAGATISVAVRGARTRLWGPPTPPCPRTALRPTWVVATLTRTPPPTRRCECACARTSAQPHAHTHNHTHAHTARVHPQARTHIITTTSTANSSTTYSLRQVPAFTHTQHGPQSHDQVQLERCLSSLLRRRVIQR
jgi:hypothetical protein